MSYFGLLACRFAPWMLAILTIIVIPRGAYADVNTASLIVSITDKTGAAIPSATIVVRNSDTNQEQHGTSGPSGSATFPFLKPGRYILTVSKENFADIVVDKIILNVGDEKQLPLVLKVGPASQTVTVDGGGLSVNTSDGSVSTVIDRKFVENIPLNGQSFQPLILMTPGVTTQSPQNNSQKPGASGEFSVNGQRTESNVYTVDGVSANTGGYIYGYGTSGTSGNLPAATALGTTQSLISVDALQEFRVASSSYSAEYGLSPGGQFSFATRSGTNEFHGSMFDYLRNNYFDANDWFNDHLGLAQTAERQNDFGGTVGGPIWIPKVYDGKDKSFFFISYEGLRLTQPTAASIQYVPTLSLRQASATALQPILNAIPKPTGPEVTIPCDGVTYACPVGQPVGTSVPSGLASFAENYSLPNSITSTSIRFDHQLTPKYKVFFRFGDTPSAAQTRSLSTLESTHQSSFTNTLGITATLSQTIVNDFRLNYTRNSGTAQYALDTFGGAQPADLFQLQGLEGPNAEASISIEPQGYGLSLEQAQSVQPQRAWDTANSLTIVNGRHTIKVGFEFRELASRLQRSTPYAYSFFNSAQSLISDNSYLSGVYIYGRSYPKYTNTALYLQDEYRANRRLNVSAGVRWEVNPPPSQTAGTLPYIVQGNPNDPNSLVLGPENTPFWKTTYLNFAPRLGIAYQVRQPSGFETVLRAGGGVFFDSGQENSAQAFGNSPGQSVHASYSNVSYPLTPVQVNLPLTNPPIAPYGATGYYFPQHLQLPYTLQWSAALEQALGKSQSVTLSYVGSNGRRLLTQEELKGGSTTGPNFTQIYLEESGTTSSYNAMQVKFQRTLSRGLQVLASYTWAHSIDFGSQSVAFSVVRGNSDFDTRQNFSLAATYDIHASVPNDLLRQIADHWAIDSRFAARTAFPVTFQGNNVTLPDGQLTYSGLDLVPNEPVYIHVSGVAGNRQINPAAFSLPASGEEGNAPRNFARGFGQDQIDLAIRRTFPIVESVNLQFRAEAFNVLNHPNFGYVNSTYGNPQFGQATQMLNQSLGTLSPLYQQGGPRSMQFALKLLF